MKRILILLLAVAALWACRPSAPLIGISCGRTTAGAASLSANYTEAVARAGGIPVIFPTVADPALAAALLKQVDESDLMLMRAALDAKKPIMAICRGEQLMNVVLGGSLYQDIPTQVDTLVKHGGGAWHRIGVEKGSVLYDLFGQDSLTVNSFHHQAVKKVAPGIRVTAYADNGIVEAYEYGDRLIAFQFHPEGMARTDDTWLAPFRYFIQMAGGK